MRPVLDRFAWNHDPVTRAADVIINEDCSTSRDRWLLIVRWAINYPGDLGEKLGRRRLTDRECRQILARVEALAVAFITESPRRPRVGGPFR